ncbi:unnamed protein product, partial [Rotaria sp. Silwood1]
MLVVGYSNHSKAFIVRKSWGEYWGDDGYCYIPYDYMANPDLSFQVYAVRQAETDDIGHEYWIKDDSINYHPDIIDEDDDDDCDIIEEEVEEPEELNMIIKLS